MPISRIEEMLFEVEPIRSEVRMMRDQLSHRNSLLEKKVIQKVAKADSGPLGGYRRARWPSGLAFR
jgi:hypothetical protein